MRLPSVWGRSFTSKKDTYRCLLNTYVYTCIKNLEHFSVNSIFIALEFFIGSGIYFKRSLTLKDLSKNANVCLNLTSLRETNQDLLPAKRGSCTLKRERRTPSETEKRNQLPKVRGQKVAPTFGYGKCFLILVFFVCTETSANRKWRFALSNETVKERGNSDSCVHITSGSCCSGTSHNLQLLHVTFIFFCLLTVLLRVAFYMTMSAKPRTSSPKNRWFITFISRYDSVAFR